MAESSIVADIFSDSSAHGVVIADGYGVQVTVRSGHLVIQDGIGRARRERRIPRMPRTMERLVILGGTGMITTEAIRWLADMAVPWVHLDRDGRTIAMSGPLATDDARLIRAQSRAGQGGDLADSVGQEIMRYLLSVKLAGQAENLRQYFGATGAAEMIGENREALATADAPMTCEGRSADIYWSVWSGRIAVPFSPTDSLKVPATWLGFVQRPSLNGRQPVNADATDPVNAILNYLYKIAETECVHACHAFGLHPSLGITHSDKPGRDSLALDLLEAIRPACDRVTLELLAPDGLIPYSDGKPAYIDRRWLQETCEGTCRILAPLTHRLASHAAELGEAIQSHAHHVAKTLANAASGIVSVKRPVKTVKPTGIHRGASTAKLRSGVTASQIIPDAIWTELRAMLPMREARGVGSGIKPPTRELVASIVIRYTLRCGWSDCPVVDKRLVNRWRDHWRDSGAWTKAESILSESGHLAALLV